MLLHSVWPQRFHKFSVTFCNFSISHTENISRVLHFKSFTKKIFKKNNFTLSLIVPNVKQIFKVDDITMIIQINKCQITRYNTCNYIIVLLTI